MESPQPSPPSDQQLVDQIVDAVGRSFREASVLKTKMKRKEDGPQTLSECDCSGEQAAYTAALQVAASLSSQLQAAMAAASTAYGQLQNCLQNCH